MQRKSKAELHSDLSSGVPFGIRHPNRKTRLGSTSWVRESWVQGVSERSEWCGLKKSSGVEAELGNLFSAFRPLSFPITT